MTADWPDLVIAALVVVFAVRGYRNGCVAELAGTVAVGLAALAAFWYGGGFDGDVERLTHLGPGSGHVIAMLAVGAAVYALVLTLAWLLNRVARWPLAGIGNALGGALLGALKALIGVWAVLYVLLFFPLSPDLRTDLHRSVLAHLVTDANPPVDGIVRSWLPWFLRPLAAPLFGNHHV